MLSYLVSFIQAFIPLSLITGILLSVWRPVHGRTAARPLLIALVVGLLAGLVAYPVSFRQETVTATRACLYGAAIVAALLNSATLFLPGRGSRIGWWSAMLLTATLAAADMFTFLGRVYEQALSVTTVLNTELILNIGGILAGLFLMAFLVPLTAHLGVKCGRGVVPGILVFASLLLVVQWSAEVLLALMRLEMVELTSIRLSFVAKAGKYSNLFPYVHALLVTALAIVFFVCRSTVAQEALAEMEKAERRKARCRIMFEMRWFKSALASVVVILAVLLYHDVYATRPPKISTPVELTPDAAGLVRIKIADVADGKLHRYSYVTDDGHVVRFFLINRSRGQAKIGVVYDACMLCGDMGYVQEKNEVICIACNVRIFVPSIGKAGGCNPIPLIHKVEGEYVVVSVQELDNGARYFSQVVSKKVKDPVTGRELESSKAPFRYEYKGRTYFFESEESGEKFKQSPEKYVGEQQTRYYRVQGYKES
ncbi:Fe-S-containing protein [Geobacter sp.]|uniref:Fe-S-containing protein n=1 Tax=Geobacter sp. TaxID=46610 RepID=UPI002608714A|nr:Fe-S-containing protein [Geobacter sp.]